MHDGLSYSLWLPDIPARGGVVVLHGAGSCKENHHDFARAALGADLAAIVFDQRGHGESDGPMDGRALGDVGQMADLLRARMGARDVALRGSSMGGYLALVSARAGQTATTTWACTACAQRSAR